MTYFAVPDPSDSEHLVYLHENKAGKLRLWPPNLAHQRRPAAWWSSVREEIARDPLSASVLFAIHEVRCCRCGRRLTDPESKAYGLGRDCRREIPSDALGILARHVSKIHRELTERRSP